MQALDPLSPAAADASRASLAARIQGLAAELSAEELGTCLGIVAERARDAESLRDAVSTRLMEGFRQRTGRATFGLLYELNQEPLLQQVAARLRRFSSRSDPRDVLQEVFFNIYRYPHRFNGLREDAFRVWSAMIVRNTVLKHLRTVSGSSRQEIAVEDLSSQPAPRSATPLAGAIEEESRAQCARTYLTYLHLYLHFYGELSQRERTALRMVEVEDQSYRQAAEALGIRLENLKMVVFRARRKIHRSMRRVFDGVPESGGTRGVRTPLNGNQSNGTLSKGSGGRAASGAEEVV